MAGQVDLRQLAVERTSTPSKSPRRKRVWLTRWGLPLAIVAGFAAIVGWSARDQWRTATSVTVVPVLLSKAEVHSAGAPLFNAAGWIEPRPTAVMCSALVEGVIDELLVVEGQEVRAKDPVATLIDADARLNLREAESVLALREAERDAAKAVLAAARTNFEQPVHLEAAYAEADVALATLETEHRNLPFAIQAAEARLTLAQQDLEGKKQVAAAIAGRSVQKAQSEYDIAHAAVMELKQRDANLAHQRDASRRKRDALKKRLELKSDEIRDRDEATANLAAAEARVEQARLAVENARLRLERMVVRAPITGRVLALNAQPGRRLMGINAASERDASTVVTLYDPTRLQVRADVRLENVPQVQVGQTVRIATAAVKQPLLGQVLAMTSQADLLKNTLQVKVSIDDPSPLLRPDMLAQITFLAPEQADSQLEREKMRLLVPRELVETHDGRTFVWVADTANRVARRQSIELGPAGTDQLVEVAQGVNAFDKLIVAGRQSLDDGARIRVLKTDDGAGTSTK